ncbi:MAG TPA: hypothetical protein VKE23_06310, partial [Candidatus Limnocylindria bacterium]|nr:hypothetical protein [Candidatus Limnocylindria bacterium]
MAVSRIAFAVSPSLLNERDQWTGAIRYQVRATDHLDHGFHRVPPSTPDGRSLDAADLGGYPRFAVSARLLVHKGGSYVDYLASFFRAA